MARSTQWDWHSLRRFTSRRRLSRPGTIRRPLERLLRGERLEDRRLLALIPPVLSSLPGAPVTLHIDFDGTPAFLWNPGDDIDWASGPAMGDGDPIPAFSIDGIVTDFSQAELDGMTAIWQHVSEKFSPFNINVTTVAPPNYNNAVAVQMIVGGSNSDWYGSGGGVALREGFTTSASNSGFIFSADPIDAGSTALNAGDRHFIAETIAHEAGHLFGLRHQSVLDGVGNVSIEYSPGDSISAPIMGDSGNNSTKRGVWALGPSSSSDANGNPVFTGTQNDLDNLTRPGNVIAYRPDDFGSFSGSGSLNVNSQNGAVSGSGIIETNGDQDAFTFVATGPIVGLTVRNATLGGMLAPTLELIPISGNSPSVILSTTNTSATITTNNATPGQGFVLRVSPQGNAYGSLGQYTITGNVGSFSILNAGVLTVFGYEADNDLSISYNSSGDNIVVQNDIFGGSAIQLFPRSQVNSIVVNTYSGNDSIDLFGQLSVLSIPVTVNAGAGSDSLVLQGTSGNDFQGLTDDSHAYNNATSITFSLIENMLMTAFDGVDQFDVSALPASLGLTIFGGNQNDIVNLAPNNPFAISALNGPVTVFGDGGGDTLNVGSGGLHAVSGLVTYHGGGQGDVLNLFDGANPFFVNYTISDSSVTRAEPFFFGGVNYSGVSEITLDATQGPNTVNFLATSLFKMTVNGNGGDDVFSVGNGNNLAGGIGSFFSSGGEGYDTLTLNDALSTHGGQWAVSGAGTQDPEKIYLGLQTFSTAGFEKASVLAGNGNNPVRFLGTMTLDVSVNGGGGNDDFTFVGASSFRDFFDGEEGDPPFHYEVSVNGGGDFNTLTVDDASLPTDRSYGIHPSNVTATEGAPLGLDFDYDNFQSATFRAGPAPIFGGNQFHVFGTPADIPPGQQMRIFGGPVADHLVIYPRDAAGNLTINSNVTFQGNGAVDAIVVDASASSLGINYQVAGGTLSGMGAGSVFVDGNEQLTFNAGNGSDTWTQMSGPLFNPPTTINAGGGSNTFNLDASLSPNTWTINGGANLDTLNIIDSNNPSPSTSWTFNASNVVRSRDDGLGFTKTFTHAAIDHINVNATAGVDIFYVNAVPSGQKLRFNSGDSLDGMYLGSSAVNNLDSIQGAVHFDGEGGGGNMGVLDANDPTGDILHLTQNSLGAYPGDTLFGPGGSLTFTNVVNFGINPGIAINLGPGADKIYAQPMATARYTVNAGNPAGAPGDRMYLQLAFSGAINPVVSNPSFPSGNVTSLNFPTLNWTGIDQAVTILIPGDFNEDGAVGLADLAVWRNNMGVSPAGDGDGDGDTDGADFLAWQRRLGSQSALPASHSNVAATSTEVASNHESSRRGLLGGPFVVGAVGGSVEELTSAAVRRVDARAAIFSRERNRWVASRLGFVESLDNAPWREELSARRLPAVSGIERDVDRTWRDINEHGELSLSDLDFAYAEYGRSLEAVL